MAFRDNVVQGLLVLLIPPYFFIYIIIKWDLCGSLFLLMLGGWGVIGVAILIYVAIGLGLNKAAEHPLPSRSPVALVRFTDELPLGIARNSV